MYEKETQIKTVEFIKIIVTCIAGTNQGQLLLKIQNLTKYVHMVTINNNIPTQLNVMENTVIYGIYRITSNYGRSRINAGS